MGTGNNIIRSHKDFLGHPLAGDAKARNFMGVK
jgi:hypothetical protein